MAAYVTQPRRWTSNPTTPGDSPLVDGELDLVIARWRIELEGVEHRPIAAERYVIVVPAGHRLATRKRLSMADLRTE